MERPDGLGRWAPGLLLLRSRRGSDLQRDVVAGIVLAALLVPQGMAYAQLAGLPPVTGLYATLVPLLVYFVLGPSRILVLGPDSAVSPLVAAAIIPLAAAGDESARIALAGLLAVLVGSIMLAGGLSRFGFVTELLSMPVRLGYLMGIAVTVVVAQLPKLFGFSTDAESFLRGVRDFVTGLDETNPTALAIGVASLVLILGLRRVAPKVPGVFLAVVGATAVVAVLGLADEVPVVGDVPAGLPSFGVPEVSFDDLKALLPAAVGIAFVAFADTSVLSRSYAGRLRQEVDQNQELAVLGVANIATGFFQGFPLSTSSSRTAVAEDVGARSQVTGLVGAGILAVLLVLGTGLVHDLPQATLAAIVIVAVVGLIDVVGARRLRRWRRSEFTLAMVAFTGVAVLGVLWGVGIAIALSLLDFIRRAWRPHDAVLARVDNLKGYHDTERYPDARQIPGLVLYRFDAPLFFANADYFRERVRALSRSEGVSWIVVAAEPITDVDATAGESLRGLYDELDAVGIELGFAELKDPVRDRLRRYGIEMLVEQNLTALGESQYEAIFTTDPHSLNTLRNEYPAYGLDKPVYHYTELFADLVARGVLSMKTPLTGTRVTYHDPCYLARYNRITDAPRKLIEATGAELVEMPRNGVDTFCCGAGGGRMWMMDGSETEERPSEQRIREAQTLGKLDYFLVSCPKDLAMYGDAVKVVGADFEVAELTALVEQALGEAEPVPRHAAQGARR